MLVIDIPLKYYTSLLYFLNFNSLHSLFIFLIRIRLIVSTRAFCSCREAIRKADKELARKEMEVGMMLKIAISEYLTVLSSAVQQVLHTEIHIQPILEATVVALNVDTNVIGFLNEVELLVMSHIAYVCHRRELLGKP